MGTRITVFGPNLPASLANKGTFIAHKDGCAHTQRWQLKHQDQDTFEYDSRMDVTRSIYPPGDFEWDGTVEDSDGYLNDIHFAPCLTDLPLDAGS